MLPIKSPPSFSFADVALGKASGIPIILDCPACGAKQSMTCVDSIMYDEWICKKCRTECLYTEENDYYDLNSYYMYHIHGVFKYAACFFIKDRHHIDPRGKTVPAKFIIEYASISPDARGWKVLITLDRYPNITPANFAEKLLTYLTFS